MDVTAELQQDEHGRKAKGIPVSLRIIAYVHILIGTLSITETLLRLFIFDFFYLDVFGLLSIFIGRGLLHWRERWRGCAVVLGWLFLTAAIVGIGLSLWDICTGFTMNVSASLGSYRGGPGLAVLVGCCLGTFFGWQLHTLNRADIACRFREAQQKSIDKNNEVGTAEASRPFQFSLGSLFLITALVSFISLRLTDTKLLYELQPQTMSTSRNRVIFHVDYGLNSSRFFNEQDHLAYAVFSSGRGHLTRSTVQIHRGAGGIRVELQNPEGDTISLPSGTQLYEIDGETLFTSDESVTWEEFNSFIQARPQDWSLDGLLEHVKDLRKTP